MLKVREPAGVFLLTVRLCTLPNFARGNYALVTLLVESGLRVGEVCQLRVGDLNVRDRSGQVKVREGNGRKERKVPLDSNARRALRLYLQGREHPQPEDHVFLSERGGKPLALRTVQATLAELGRRARIPAAASYAASDAAHLRPTVSSTIPASWSNWQRY